MASTGQTARTVGYGRLRMVAAGVAVAGLLLGVRAVHLSVVEGGSYGEAMAAEQGGEVAPDEEMSRGDILSADGRRLATSVGAYQVVSTPYQIEQPAEAARRLASVLELATGQDAAEIEGLITRRGESGAPSGYSVVASEVDPETARRVRELEIEGVTLAPDLKRVYPDGTLASRVTGHLGADRAFGGIEEHYDEALSSGESVTTTLDSAVQQELQGTLEETVKEHGAKGALGLVMRVEDGAIVALANSPGYDNNRFGEVPAGIQRNKVLTDPYEPGSTFKAFTVAAALEEGAVNEESTFVVPDSIAVADRVIHDSEPHATETMTPGTIIQKSSNVGAIQVAQVLGGESLSRYIERFGFGKTVDVDLPSEDPGAVPVYADWSGSSIGNIPIGQGLTVTPLQLAAGYATIASGGTKVTPHVTESSSPAAPGPRVISEKTSDIVRGMLQSVVEEGSGHLAQIPGYTVAGKTGTSQKVDPETGAYGDSYVASFIGFAPATDPEYLVLIVVDEPETSYWGEVVAAPAFQKVMSFTLGYLNVPPDQDTADRREAS